MKKSNSRVAHRHVTERDVRKLLSTPRKERRKIISGWHECEECYIQVQRIMDRLARKYRRSASKGRVVGKGR